MLEVAEVAGAGITGKPWLACTPPPGVPVIVQVVGLYMCP